MAETFLEKFTRCAKGLWAFILDCAFRMLIGWAGKLWSRGHSKESKIFKLALYLDPKPLASDRVLLQFTDSGVRGEPGVHALRLAKEEVCCAGALAPVHPRPTVVQIALDQINKRKLAIPIYAQVILVFLLLFLKLAVLLIDLLQKWRLLISIN